jgi:galactokinase
VTRRYRIPGRIELVGKHVDYAGGRSLTCAVDLGISVRATPIDEPAVRVGDSERRSKAAVPLSPAAEATSVRWSTYVAAVARRFARDFPECTRGVQVTLASDLPASSGLSSSSALVVAVATALVDANEVESNPRWREAIPDLVARAEYFGAMETGAPFGDFAGDGGVGVRGGAQDHIAIVCAAEGTVSQFSYQPGKLERRVAFPDDLQLLVAVSGVRATKTGNSRAAYNRLADEVRSIQRGLTVRPERVAQIREESDVIVPGVGDALRDRDYDALGRLVDRSQALAESVLMNQVPETIALARLARERGAVAASAFGAGFGGAVWALARRADAAAVMEGWRTSFLAAFPKQAAVARFLAVRPAAAARELVAK